MFFFLRGCSPRPAETEHEKKNKEMITHFFVCHCRSLFGRCSNYEIGATMSAGCACLLARRHPPFRRNHYACGCNSALRARPAGGRGVMGPATCNRIHITAYTHIHSHKFVAATRCWFTSALMVLAPQQVRGSPICVCHGS